MHLLRHHAGTDYYVALKNTKGRIVSAPAFSYLLLPLLHVKTGY
jgi:hypothetical protein